MRQAARKGASEAPKFWDERTGRCLAEFFNKIRADTLVVEMGVEEGRRLSTSELIILLQVFMHLPCSSFRNKVSLSIQHLLP